MEEMFCPRTFHDFKTLMMKSNQHYTEEDIIMLYRANETLKTEGYIGGSAHLQHGGLECLTLHNIYKYSVIILLIAGGVYCGHNELYKTILIFVNMCKTAFDKDQFKHIWDVVGKTQLGFGFMERLTKYILEVSKKPEQGITMTWLKNIFELFCQVENGEKVENIEQKITEIIISNKKENPTNNIVYNGKIINIQMGDAMITISPNIFKSRNSRNSSSFVTPKGGIKQTKTKKKKTGKKRRI